ncbi:MAG: hypothetical protein ACYDBQ_09105 [Thermoplasmatota archaeon]
MQTPTPTLVAPMVLSVALVLPAPASADGSVTMSATCLTAGSALLPTDGAVGAPILYGKGEPSHHCSAAKQATVVAASTALFGCWATAHDLFGATCTATRAACGHPRGRHLGHRGPSRRPLGGQHERLRDYDGVRGPRKRWPRGCG